MPEILRYTPERASEWDDFVAHSKNGTFLFRRAYMDYHADRFTDHSLMVCDRGRLCALLPANEHDGTLFSHEGLTYGGLVTATRATTAWVCDAMQAIGEHLRREGFHRVVYKAVPWIYHRQPAEEDLYALANVCGARLAVRHISSAIDLLQRLPFTESRRSGLRKARAAGLSVRQWGADGVDAFWPVLEANLRSKYGATPVHSADEMRLLCHRFPDDIAIYTVERCGTTLGGTVVYHTPPVAHTQYISASEEGKRLGALDLLFDHVLSHQPADVRYFDFGKSSDGDGHELNHPLIFQKEGFGGRGVCYDWYEWEL